MPSQIELTLGELARIALGTSCLQPANIAVLHSLIDLLLKKLDCRDEKVAIGGYESSCLEKLLESTSIPSYAFQEVKFEILTEKFERINVLEKRVEAVHNRLEKHFDDIRECNKQGIAGVFKYQNWEHYSGACEDLCVSCEPENRIACELITNADFMKKMLRRISHPLIDRMFNFEKKVEMLHEDFKKFIEKTSEHYMKMSLVERCIREIEHLRHQVDDHHLQFLGAMEEVQDMFDAKLDKIHLPALKKYVRDRFDSLENILNSMRSTKACPETGGVILDGIKCLSCGNDRVCAEKTVLVKGAMPDAHIRNRPKISKKFCQCLFPSSSGNVNITQLIIDPKIEPAHSINVEPQLNRSKSCKFVENEFTLKEGKNGMLYRMTTESGTKAQIEDLKSMDLDESIQLKEARELRRGVKILQATQL